MSENQVNFVYISVGTNLGNKIYNIEKTKYFLSLNGIKIFKTSSYYETFSWPDPNKPKFLNIIIQLKTNLSPDKLLDIF
ncbi:2-amino-4-hydroxy-6-hydroxymethyldihydropteridine diphosphokinase [Candidatus Pelagibacter sp.]|nr:2-amino-4-hydroxy-6-hydroxymethyldihydropteridine diphosphokinase [Candidatus Pelagibacter sp.]